KGIRSLNATYMDVNPFSDQLCNTLKVNTTLTELILESSGSNSPNKSTLEKIGEGLIQNRSITSLNLAYANFWQGSLPNFGKALEVNTTLKILNLFCTDLRPEYSSHIIEGLKKNHTITDLNVGNCPLQDQGGADLIAALDNCKL